MINYKNLESIIVKTQEELADIPLDFGGRIHIEFGDSWNPAIVKSRYRYSVVAQGNSSVKAWENSSVVARGNSSVEAWGNSSVEARENSSVVAWGNSSVVAQGNSSVEARGNSSVVAWENSSVVARGNSSVKAWENSSVKARENSSVEAQGNSSVEAWGNSSVKAWENSSVVARGNSSVKAWENSSVVAQGNSSVKAWENSSVEAWGNSSVEAQGNSSVEAWGNVQVVDSMKGGRIEITGNARIVHNPKTISEYIDFYGIEHTKTKCRMFKAVIKQGEHYVSARDENFRYEIGKTAKCTESLNTDESEDCGSGIHLAYMSWCLDYGKDWDKLAIIECEATIKDIIVPTSCCGKVRTNKVKIIREVPLEECGLFGKILARRKKNEHLK